MRVLRLWLEQSVAFGACQDPDDRRIVFVEMFAGGVEGRGGAAIGRADTCKPRLEPEGI